MSLAEVLEVVSRTDSGLVRNHNEDAVFADSALGLVILADGMGGYNAGEVASGMAVTLLATQLAAAPGQAAHSPVAEGMAAVHAKLAAQIAAANLAIFNAAQSQPQYAGMGTTLVMACFHDNQISVAHVGDSRLYRLRGEQFEAITRDHSFLQQQIDSGMITEAEARLSNNRNLVTRALGVEKDVQPEINTHEVRPGDVYLLCSDGLNDMITDEEIGETLQMLGANLPLAATQLIEMANDNGGRDNVSVILVKVRGDFAAPKSWWQKLLAWLK
jgi:PPM family protein phosphatase